MKIPRAAHGKVVLLVWRDPNSMARIAAKKAPKGWAALATWTEVGIIDDVTDGVVRLIHSRGQNPPHWDDPDEEIAPTYVHEALIESLTICEPIAPAAQGAPEGG